MKNSFLSSKKLLPYVLMLILGCGIIFTGYSQSILPGDVNGDGAVNIVDALMLARYSAGLTPAGFNIQAGDVNCDGTVNIWDALVVARYSALIIKDLTCTYTPTPTPTPTPVLTPTPTCSPGTLVIAGYVKDSSNSSPLAGVFVNLTALDSRATVAAVSDAYGYYRLAISSCYSTEHVNLRGGKTGYTPFTIDTSFSCSNTNEFAINLIPVTPTPTPTFTSSPTPRPSQSCYPCAIMTKGYITDNLTALPIASAAVSVRVSAGTLYGTTDASGYYATNIVPSCGSSEYVAITIKAPNYEDLNISMSVGCSSSQNLNFCLARVPGTSASPTRAPTATP